MVGRTGRTARRPSRRLLSAARPAACLKSATDYLSSVVFCGTVLTCGAAFFCTSPALAQGNAANSNPSVSNAASALSKAQARARGSRLLPGKARLPLYRSGKTQKQMLAKEILLASLAVRRAEAKLDRQLEALAGKLPQLLHKQELTGSPSDDLPWRRRLADQVGANPFDLEPELSGEMARARATWSANHSGGMPRNNQEPAQPEDTGKTLSTENSKETFRQPLPEQRSHETRESEPRVYLVRVPAPSLKAIVEERQLPSLTRQQIEQTDNTPGTIYVLLAEDQTYLLIALTIDGNPLCASNPQEGLRGVLGHL